jgi:hypothetical protein
MHTHNPTHLVSDLVPLIRWNEEHGIRFFR